jgi:hypothetical protein
MTRVSKTIVLYILSDIFVVLGGRIILAMFCCLGQKQTIFIIQPTFYPIQIPCRKDNTLTYKYSK